MNKLRWTCNSVGGLNEPVPVQTLNLSTCYSSVCMCVCVCPSKYAQQAAICQQWSLPWVILVWSNHNFNHVSQLNNFGTHLSNWNLTWQFYNSNKNTWICSMLTQVMCLMQCSTKCSCQYCFCNELQWCCMCHYFLNINLPCDFFNLLWPFTVPLFTCQVPLAKCFLLKVFLKIRMCMSKMRRKLSTWRLGTKAHHWPLHARTTDFNALACHGTQGKNCWVV